MEAVPVRRTRSQARKEQQQQQHQDQEQLQKPSVEPVAPAGDGGAAPKQRSLPGKKRTAVPRRRPLADVTNDSPMGKSSPAAAAVAAAVKKSSAAATDEEAKGGDGESLLRSQVQSLLEAKTVVDVSSFVFSSPCSVHGGPTPANTPAGGAAMTNVRIDAAEVDDDDKSSTWSVDVNISSPDKIEEELAAAAAKPVLNPWMMRDTSPELIDQEEEDEVIDQVPEEDEAIDEEEEDEVVDDELCRGVRGICMSEKKPLFSRFAGKHTRYMYNSDDELEWAEVTLPPAAAAAAAEPSPSVTVLHGVPLAAGKHLRFQDDQSP